MKILVTGGAGYVGSTLVDLLSQRGEEVRSIDNYVRGKYEKIKELDEREGVEFLNGDIQSDKKVEKAMEGRDAVVHLAALPGLELCAKNPRKAITTNIYGTWNLLQKAVQQGIERFIFASSAAVYGIPQEFPIKESEPREPINLYGVTKATSERLVNLMNKKADIATVTLRFANIYGMGWYTHWETVVPKFVRLAVHGKALPVYGNGKQTRDFIHVKDVAEGIIHCLQGKEEQINGETFNLGSGKATSINQVANIVQKKFSKLTGRQVEVRHTEKREGEPYLPNFRFAIDKIKEHLGFEPEIVLDAGIEELIRQKI